MTAGPGMSDSCASLVRVRNGSLPGWEELHFMRGILWNALVADWMGAVMGAGFAAVPEWMRAATSKRLPTAG